MFVPRQSRFSHYLELNATGSDFMFHRFHSLNISKSGLLIASSDLVTFNKFDLLHLVIDPWEEYLDGCIPCTAIVARKAKFPSKLWML